RQIDGIGSLNFFVTSEEPAERTIPRIRAVIAQLDPTVPLDNLRPLVNEVADMSASDRLLSRLSGGFAVVATLLAAIGLYGMLAYTLTQRTHELGVRMALGATRLRIGRMVLAQVSRMMLAGELGGTLAAMALGRLAQSQLFQVSGFDPLITVVAAM